VAPTRSGRMGGAYMRSKCGSVGEVQPASVYTCESEGSIFSNPTASAHSACPDSTSVRARNSAVEPVAQLLLTLKTGAPDSPSSYATRWPHVGSP